MAPSNCRSKAELNASAEEKGAERAQEAEGTRSGDTADQRPKTEEGASNVAEPRDDAAEEEEGRDVVASIGESSDGEPDAAAAAIAREERPDMVESREKTARKATEQQRKNT